MNSSGSVLVRAEATEQYPHTSSSSFEEYQLGFFKSLVKKGINERLFCLVAVPIERQSLLYPGDVILSIMPIGRDAQRSGII